MRKLPAVFRGWHAYFMTLMSLIDCVIRKDGDSVDSLFVIIMRFILNTKSIVTITTLQVKREKP